MKKLISIILLAGVLAESAIAQTPEQNKRSTHEAYQALAKYDFDTFLTYIADDAVDYGQGAMPVNGKMAIATGLKGFFKAFQGYTLTVDGIAVDGNRVYVQNTFKGTQKEKLFNMIPPTGKTIEWRDVDVLEFNQQGKIAAHWAMNPNAPFDQLGYHSLTNPNTAVVMEAYYLFGKGDIAGILAGCSPDIVFDITDRVFLPNGMIYKGPAEVVNFFKTLTKSITFTRFEPYRYLADGDDVVVFINGEYKDNKTGKMSKATIVHQVKVINGKIVWLKGLTDAPKPITMATK
ncbi:nuclear transport factor 2 family protein [Spirosoma sp. SC4-14]|uniref:nuclear transport factor 2 family protein n=1 Tax=Spirosoma sp. SC4-14 TaxID=3128900 RepID=UPI0030D4D233